MSILFSIVARGTTVLAKHASCYGNFTEVVEQVLTKLSPENGELIYQFQHYYLPYICEDKIIYLAIIDSEFDHTLAFNFLRDIKQRFQSTYGNRANTALPYAMQSEFSRILEAQMNYFSVQRKPSLAARESDSLVDVSEKQSLLDSNRSKVDHLRSQVNEVHQVMVRNIDTVMDRGERLDLLVNRSEDLENTSLIYRRSAERVRRKMWWKNVKMWVILILVITGLLALIILLTCVSVGGHCGIGK